MELDVFRFPRKDAWFFGRYSRGPDEEDFGVFVRALGDRVYVKTTWEGKWRKVTVEKLLSLLREVYEEVRSW